MRSAVPLLLALPLLATACANGRVGEQDDIRGVVRTFLDQCGEQRVLYVLPELVPAAQKVVATAPSPARGCAAVLRLPASAPLTVRDFRDATVRVTAFDGGRARVLVGLAGARRILQLSRGSDRWRIEAA